MFAPRSTPTLEFSVGPVERQRHQPPWSKESSQRALSGLSLNIPPLQLHLYKISFTSTTRVLPFLSPHPQSFFRPVCHLCLHSVRLGPLTLSRRTIGQSLFRDLPHSSIAAREARRQAQSVTVPFGLDLDRPYLSTQLFDQRPLHYRAYCLTWCEQFGSTEVRWSLQTSDRHQARQNLLLSAQITTPGASYTCSSLIN